VIRPAIDGRLAARIREIAQFEQDSVLAGGVMFLTGEEKARILNIAADVFEEYIMEARA
jgi:hypothetical protein